LKSRIYFSHTRHLSAENCSHHQAILKQYKSKFEEEGSQDGWLKIAWHEGQKRSRKMILMQVKALNCLINNNNNNNNNVVFP